MNFILRATKRGSIVCDQVLEPGRCPCLRFPACVVAQESTSLVEPWQPVKEPVGCPVLGKPPEAARWGAGAATNQLAARTRICSQLPSFGGQGA